MKLKLICISFVYCIACYGNVQHGYVKTIARENKPSQRVNLVAITLRDSQMVISDSTSLGEGTFSFETQDEYGFRSIRKSGYAVLDKDILAVTKPYTPSPVEVLVYNIAEKEKEKQEYVENQTRVMYTNYRKQMAILEQQVADHIKSEEQVRQERLALQESLDKYQQMVEDIAEYYALLNYEDLDSVEIAIDKAMKAGDMEEAYRLITQEFDINTLVVDSRKEESEIAEQRALAQKMMDNANIKDSIHRKEIEKKADMLYNLHTIYLSRFQNDSAAFCLTQRAELDTTNIEWQFAAGLILSRTHINYNLALAYFNRAVQCSIAQFGEQNMIAAFNYYGIGESLFTQTYFVQALDFYEKALTIFLQNKNDFAEVLAGLYDDMGSVYHEIGNYNQALKMYHKAIKITYKLEFQNSVFVANVYNHIGQTYATQQQYDNATETFYKALDILKQVISDENIEYACTYNNLGCVFTVQRKYDEALNMHQKALRLVINSFGNNSLEVTMCYNNIGAIYLNQGKCGDALEQFQEALRILIQIFGENHVRVATVYTNIGNTYRFQKEYMLALEMFQKALHIQLELLGENHPDVLTTYKNIGYIYMSQNDIEQALIVYQKILSIQIETLGEYHPDILETYTHLIDIYTNQNNYLKVLEIYQKTLEVSEHIYGKNDESVKQLRELVKQLKILL